MIGCLYSHSGGFPVREFTVMFRSVKEIGEFVSIANRQSFSVQLLYGSTVLDASSILSLCCLGLNRPLTVRVCGGEQSEDFCRVIQPYLVEPANAG